MCCPIQVEKRRNCRPDYGADLQLQLTQTNFIDLLTAAVDSAGLAHSLLRLEIPGSGTYWAGEYALLVLKDYGMRDLQSAVN